jgi:hypothetical protein
MKRTRLNRISKSPRRALELEADRLWSSIVLAEGGGKCLYCGKRPGNGACHPHHIVGRANKTYRHNPNNGISMCWNCHRLIEGDCRQQFHEWLAYSYPAKAALLSGRWHSDGPVTCSALRETIEKLTS